MRRALFAACAVLALGAIAALVLVFVFAYTATFRHGADDDLSGAAMLTFLIACMCAFGSVLAGATAMEMPR